MYLAQKAKYIKRGKIQEDVPRSESEVHQKREMQR